jgi:protocatechuate 3,4-dioxygenase beta subunit
MRNVAPNTVTQAFLDYMGPGTDPRLREVMTALARHLHDFTREIHLTHDEWRTAIALLTRAGEITTGERNEFVLFSDVLGLSSLVDMINSPPGATTSSVLGPFHVLGAPDVPLGGDLRGDNAGGTLVVGGHVRDTDGNPIKGAALEIWQNADNGLYSSQDPDQDEYNLRARQVTGADGRYLFSTTRPIPYKAPDDGRWGNCCGLPGAIPGGPRICISS